MHAKSLHSPDKVILWLGIRRQMGYFKYLCKPWRNALYGHPVQSSSIHVRASWSDVRGIIGKVPVLATEHQGPRTLCSSPKAVEPAELTGYVA